MMILTRPDIDVSEKRDGVALTFTQLQDFFKTLISDDEIINTIMQVAIKSGMEHVAVISLPPTTMENKHSARENIRREQNINLRKRRACNRPIIAFGRHVAVSELLFTADNKCAIHQIQRQNQRVAVQRERIHQIRDTYSISSERSNNLVRNQERLNRISSPDDIQKGIPPLDHKRRRPNLRILGGPNKQRPVDRSQQQGSNSLPSIRPSN